MYRMALNCGFDTEEERDNFKKQIILLKGLIGAKNATILLTNLVKSYLNNRDTSI